MCIGCMCLHLILLSECTEKNALEKDNNRCSCKSHNFKAEANLAISGPVPLFYR